MMFIKRLSVGLLASAFLSGCAVDETSQKSAPRKLEADYKNITDEAHSCYGPQETGRRADVYASIDKVTKKEIDVSVSKFVDKKIIGTLTVVPENRIEVIEVARAYCGGPS